MKWIKEEMIKSRGNKEQDRKDRWGTFIPPPHHNARTKRGFTKFKHGRFRIIQKETHFHTINMWKAQLHDIVNPAGLSRWWGTSLHLNAKTFKRQQFQRKTTYLPASRLQLFFIFFYTGEGVQINVDMPDTGFLVPIPWGISGCLWFVTGWWARWSLQREPHQLSPSSQEHTQI